MFILSFIFVILVVCGLFEWMCICASYFCRLFIFALPLQIQLSRGVCDSNNRFNPASFVYLCPARTRIYSVICRVRFVFDEWEVLVRFVDKKAHTILCIIDKVTCHTDVECGGFSLVKQDDSITSLYLCNSMKKGLNNEENGQ